MPFKTNSLYKIRYISIFFILIAINTVSAQFNPDSVKRVIAKAHHDTTKINAYMFWDGEIYLSNYKLDIELNEKVKAICEKNLALNGLSKKEKKFYQIQLGKTYNNIGLALSNQGLYPEAHQLFFEGLEVAQKSKDTSTISNLYNNIGVVYWNKKDFKRAENYFLKGIELETAIGDEQGKSDVYNNLGLVYRDMKDKVRALDCFRKSLSLNKPGINESGRANNYHNIALIFKDIGEPDTAMKYFLKAIEIFREIDFHQGLSNSLSAIGEEYNSANNPEVAIQHCGEALKIGQDQRLSPAIRDACNCLYISYKLKGDKDKALEYFEKYIRIDDSLSNKQWSSEIDKIELRHEFKQKEQEIKIEEEKKNILAKAENHRQQIIIYCVSGGLAIVLILAMIILKNLRVNKQKSRIISEQKALVEEKQKEIVDSINYAKRIQYALLAHDTVLKANLNDYFVLFKPKDIVSGDFYWATKLNSANDQSFYLAVCDSTGHGVPGAFMSLLNISFLNEAINEKSIKQPSKVFDHVRERLIENIAHEGAMDGMDGVLMRMENHEGKMRIIYSGANKAPVIVRNGECIELDSDNMHVGFTHKFNQFAAYEFLPQKGDMLYLFTDGFYDQFGGPGGKKFKKSNLKKLLTEVSSLPVEEQKRRLEKRLEEWKGNLEQIDDVCVIGVKL